MDSQVKRKVIVFGTSPFSRMMCALLCSAGIQVVARTAHERFIPPPNDLDLKAAAFTPFEDLVQTFAPEEHEVLVALEHARWNAARAEIANEAKEKGYRLASYVHPTAQFGPDVTLGEHVMILEGVLAQYGACIGDNAIVGAQCFLGQQANIAADTYLGSLVVVDRFARIQEHCVLGSGVRIGESVNVPAWTQIKAFEDVSVSPTQPTLIHEALREPGFIIDRRDA